MESIKVLLFGASGMIGQAVLLECLQNEHVEKVLMINRKSLNKKHPKLKEIIHPDFFNFSSIESEFKGYNACFNCIGISSVGVSETAFSRIIYDQTIYIAELVLKQNQDVSYSFVTGAGCDSTEKGRVMWARVKGRTENKLLTMGFKGAYMFRPGYIQPMDGIKSRTRLYNMLYLIFKPFYFLLKSQQKTFTDSRTLARAFINCILLKEKSRLLEIIDINKIGKTNI